MTCYPPGYDDHLFEKITRWPRRERWRCVFCGFRTRTYDGADRMAQRPIHSAMSVAVPGFNTAFTKARRWAPTEGQNDAG